MKYKLIILLTAVYVAQLFNLDWKTGMAETALLGAIGGFLGALWCGIFVSCQQKCGKLTSNID